MQGIIRLARILWAWKTRTNYRLGHRGTAGLYRQLDARIFLTTGIRKLLEDDVGETIDPLPTIACDKFYVLKYSIRTYTSKPVLG